jgi:AcrR family transcriptional regulator
MSTYPDQAVARRRSRGRPPKISQEAIVAAAIAVGLDRLTMARLAAELGVSTQALYGHVRGRDEVEALVRGALRDEVQAAPIDADDWRTWLEQFANVVRRSLGGSAAHVLDAPTADLALGERGIELLLAEGLRPDDAGRAIWLVFRLALLAGADPNDAALATLLADTGALLASGDRVAPATGAVQAALTASPDPDPDTFAFDLALILDGIEARIARTRPEELS